MIKVLTSIVITFRVTFLYHKLAVKGVKLPSLQPTLVFTKNIKSEKYKH